jgi:hypothetical protein
VLFKLFQFAAVPVVKVTAADAMHAHMMARVRRRSR